MADKKLTGLTATTTAANTDIIHVVNDPGGTPASRKIVLSDFFSSNTELSDLDGYLNGMSIERQSLSVVVSGTSVYLDVESTDAGDIDYWINSTKYTLNCTTGSGAGGAARIEIPQGTAISPQVTLIYVAYDSQSSSLQLFSTSPISIPSGYFVPVAVITIQDYSSVTTNGALVLQRTTETIEHNGKGAISWGREKLRALGAQYWGGIDQSLTITTNGGSEDNIQFDTTSGVVFQLHRQSLDDVDMSVDGIFVANASGDGTLTNYQKLTDLNSIHEIADGTALVTGDSINLVIWGSVNYGGENKLFINLPNAKYTNDNDAVLDSNKTAITTIPNEFKTTGYLIAKLVLKYTTADSGTWENLLTASTEVWSTESQSWNTSNWPSNYDNDDDELLATLTKVGAEKVRVRFSEFNTEANYDFISIRNASDSFPTSIAERRIDPLSYHGNLGAFTSAEIDGTTMRVQFTSDGSVNRSGVRSISYEYMVTESSGSQFIDLRGIPTGFNLGASGGVASVSHNSLEGKQGGTTDEYYHITSAQHSVIGTPEGTVILSTGETGGTKYLREDGDGTCSWQTPAGGSDQTVIAVAAATYTLLTDDDILHVTYTSTGACTITIPTALITNNRQLTVVDAGNNAGTNNITIATEGTEQINFDSNDFIIDLDKRSVSFYCYSNNIFRKE